MKITALEMLQHGMSASSTFLYNNNTILRNIDWERISILRVPSATLLILVSELAEKFMLTLTVSQFDAMPSPWNEDARPAHERRFVKGECRVARSGATTLLHTYRTSSAGKPLREKTVARISDRTEVTVAEYVYNDADLLLIVTSPSDHGPLPEWFEYDQMGRLLRRCYPDYGIEYAYDADGRLTSELDLFGIQLARYHYDDKGRLIIEQKQETTYSVVYYDDGTVDIACKPDVDAFPVPAVQAIY